MLTFNCLYAVHAEELDTLPPNLKADVSCRELFGCDGPLPDTIMCKTCPPREGYLNSSVKK